MLARLPDRRAIVATASRRMRLILTPGFGSLDALAKALSGTAGVLDVVTAEDPAGVSAQIAEGDLNVVLVPSSGDLTALREALLPGSLEERPLVLLVDLRTPSAETSTHLAAPTDDTASSAVSGDIGSLPAIPLDWTKPGVTEGEADADSGAGPVSGDGPVAGAGEAMNLREWLDALARVTDGALLRVDKLHCVSIDAAWNAKLGFRPLLKDGDRVLRGFAGEDRRLLLEWLAEHNPSIRLPAPGAQAATAASHLLVSMRSAHGYHPVVMEQVDCTGIPGSSRILLVSQAGPELAGTLTASRAQGDMDTETGLTGLGGFMEDVRRAISRARSQAQGCAVLVCRLEGIGRIDRMLGSVSAAAALQTAAARLRRAGGDVESMARLGPHEFGFVFVSSDPQSVIEQQILRFRRAIQPPITGGDHPLSISLRFGVSEFTQSFWRPRALVRLARSRAAAALLLDQALPRIPERANRGGVAHGVPLEREIERACREQEFEIMLQPTIHLRSFQVSGAEVLVRWRHPVRGLLAPAHFLPIAESTGQVSQIGQWVLQEVCANAKSWGRLFPERACFAVNVSPVELHDDRFLATTLGILGKYPLGNTDVELEITETAVLASERKTAEVVELLRRQGVRVALDDFGVGYSSLAHLREIPFSKLKIDRTFVHGATASHRCRTIVRSMAELGKGLRVTVNAEGVETAEQLRFLYEAGCDEVQGYLFARPMPPQRFESWVAGYQGKALGAFDEIREIDGGSKVLPFARARHPG